MLWNDTTKDFQETLLHWSIVPSSHKTNTNEQMISLIHILLEEEMYYFNMSSVFEMKQWS